MCRSTTLVRRHMVLPFATDLCLCMGCGLAFIHLVTLNIIPLSKLVLSEALQGARL